MLCPFESGMQILRIPEIEFLQRLMRANPSMGEKAAKAFYTSLWKLLIDARTAERKKKLKYKGKSDAQRAREQREELQRRLESMTEEEKAEEERIWQERMKNLTQGYRSTK